MYCDVSKMSKIRYKSLWALFSLSIVINQSVLVESLKLADANDPNVTFHPAHNKIWSMDLEENIASATLFLIVDVDQSVKPEINNDVCNTFLNNYELLEDGDHYKFLLKAPLDYEQNNCHTIQGGLRDSSDFVSFKLNVINVDDNDPQIILKNKCEMKENTGYTLSNSSCLLDISDLDGMLDKTALSIESEDNEEKIFDVQFFETPNDEEQKAVAKIILRGKIQLNYEDTNMHIFTVKAQGPERGNDMQMIVSVIDMPDQKPIWKNMFTTQQFPENTDKEFTVKAIDGDLGINSPIKYEITKNSCNDNNRKCKMAIDSTSGIITVKNVDREDDEDTLLLDIKAIEDDDGSSCPLSITFFIQDEDDNVPKISIDGKKDDETYTFEKDEDYAGTITKFTVEDMDLGDSGRYDISLIDIGEVKYSEAFQVVPSTGYQKGEFQLNVRNSSKLDFENEVWKSITFKLQAKEVADKSHIDTKTIILNLNDINDEWPIFKDTADSAQVLESIKKGEKIFDALATDADAGDVVTYEILGVWKEQLDISEEGLITPKKDNVFDYEQIHQVIIQIQASDKVKHQTTKTLTIVIGDVDDEPPSVKVSNNRASIKENSPANTILDQVTITATDPDTKPKLELAIDWDTTTFSKNSQPITAPDDWRCFDLVVDHHDENAVTISGILRTHEGILDFEQFDSIQLYFIATDKNTEIGIDNAEGYILVNIEDQNDNPPVFRKDTLVDLVVTDNTKGVAKIGTVTATDVDLNDKVTYAIKALDADHDWVEINEQTGQLSVKKDVVINDDLPPRKDISFNITAFDLVDHRTYAEVTISMTDINNQKPKILGTKEEVSIKEKSGDGTDVILLSYQDDDRDYPYNYSIFRFNNDISDQASNCFHITDEGHVTVLLRNGASLDRDAGPVSYKLPIIAYDNPNGFPQNTADAVDIIIILEDINDHSPEILTKTLTFSENDAAGMESDKIQAQDIDQEGDNSNIKFELLEITPLSQENKNILDLSFFDISTEDNKTATITLLKDLKSYYGDYTLTIKTSDYGVPVMSQSNTLTLTVTKFNFKMPKFVFPNTDDAIILDEIQTPNARLKLFGGDFLQDFEIDDQQNHKWNIDFSIITEDGGKPDLFTIKNTAVPYKGRLLLARLLTVDDRKLHKLTISASLEENQQNGEAPTSVQTSFTVNFFSSTEAPTFSVSDYKMSIDENSLAKLQPHIPKATFKSYNELQAFYFLLNEIDVFTVDVDSGDVSVKEALDYEKTQSFNIQIGASNSRTSTNQPEGPSVLSVLVQVNDLNDNVPVFHPSKFYGAYIKSSTTQSTIILILNATDEDKGDAHNLHYFASGEMKCEGNFENQKPAFIVDEGGNVKPNFTVTSDMSGYCIFQVNVLDNKDKYNTVNNVTTSVQINIISDDDLVEFTFENHDSDINVKQEQIRNQIDTIFEKYKYKSYMADFHYNPDYSNTTAHFYFLDETSEAPIKASSILSNLTDSEKFSKLKKSLAQMNIYLENFSRKSNIQAIEDYLKIWLLATTFVLASLLLLLSIAFFFRNRALTQRISNLSTTKFGSQESGLNRAGVSAPTTNRNAIEGSNPVYNSENYVNEVEPDRHSVISGDSDLFGVENNPEFEIADDDSS